MMFAMQRLVLVSGWTGAGKSTVANTIATDLACTVGSFDWLMSALRPIDEVWNVVELPVERQRSVGWSLLSRLAEQELRRGRDIVLDLVAREVPRQEWSVLADRYGASFSVVECVCSDVDVHRARVEGRARGHTRLVRVELGRRRARSQKLRTAARSQVGDRRGRPSRSQHHPGARIPRSRGSDVLNRRSDR